MIKQVDASLSMVLNLYHIDLIGSSWRCGCVIKSLRCEVGAQYIRLPSTQIIHGTLFDYNPSYKYGALPIPSSTDIPADERPLPSNKLYTDLIAWLS